MLLVAVVAAILLAVPVLIAILVAIRAVLLLLLLGLLGLTARILFPLSGGQKPGVMLRVLLEIFQRNAVARQLRITRKLVVLFDDLLRGATHLALGT
ncbi:hypothetical protein PM03_11200 [Thalassobacter stenotrophicus]|nr:hypothetical protein PM03_11200 [Thalassobacter stenotrophicus]KGL03155.1 hypothetical protein PM04_03335 [Thalassobacter sp. 16PALIMAR09]